MDALSAALASLSVPSVLSTIEDFMWCKLALVSGAEAQVGGQCCVLLALVRRAVAQVCVKQVQPGPGHEVKGVVAQVGYCIFLLIAAPSPQGSGTGMWGQPESG